MNPHTIGPSSATWTVTQRPVSIDGANIVLNTTSPATYVPLTLRDYQWWLAQRVPGVTTTLPTDLYYAPGWQNGSVYLWPVPTVAYDIQLMTRQLLASVALSDTFTQPPAYRKALTLTLAEELAPTFSVQVPTQTAKGAREARASLEANNAPPVGIVTNDAGMPSSESVGVRNTWNYYTGMETT